MIEKLPAENNAYLIIVDYFVHTFLEAYLSCCFVLLYKMDPAAHAPVLPVFSEALKAAART